MNKQSQHGKGLSGFFSGLLLATAVIIGILFFLNRENRGFKEVKPAKEVSETEVLQPKGNRQAPRSGEEAETVPGSGGVTGGETAPETIPTIPDTVPETGSGSTVAEPKPETAPRTETAGSAAVSEETVSQPKPEQPAVIAPPRAETVKKPAAEDRQKARAERRAAERKAEQKPAAKESKPTPEQILNSGSIEKAREAHARQTAKADSGKASSGGAAEKSASGRKVILQMGSYADRKSADTQRAKLAMMGVSSSVVESSANGKTVFRVQSAPLAQDAAASTRRTLQQNGVNSFARSAQ